MNTKKRKCSLTGVGAVLLGILAAGSFYGCGEGTTSSATTDVKIKIVGKLIDRQLRKPVYNGSAADQTSNGGIAVSDLTIVVRAGDEFFSGTSKKKNDTSSSTSGDKTNAFNEQGYFSAEVPVASTYEIRVSGTGYATYALRFNPVSFAGGDTDNQTVAKIQDLGTMTLTKAVSLTVNLVDALTGDAVTGATVYATTGVGGASSVAENDVGAGGLGATTGDAAYGALEIACIDGNTTANLPDLIADSSATADGSCVLSGLNPLVDYNVVIPPFDSDADGIYNYVTAVSNMDEGLQGGASSAGDAGTRGTPTSVSVALVRAAVDDTPAIVATSCGQYSAVEDTLMTGCATSGVLPLRFVFNYPISALATSQFQLVQNAEAAFTTDSDGDDGQWGSAAVDFNGDGDRTDGPTEVTVTAALSANNTVLTLTPSAALTANGLHSVRGTVTASIPGGGAVGNIVSSDFDTLFETFTGDNTLIYAFADSDTTVTDPTMDNYNGDDDGGAAAALCLEFDEAVIGSAKVIATTTGTVTTQRTAVTSVNLNTGSLINEGGNATEAAVCGALAGCPTASNGACAASTAIKYAVPLGITLADDVVATPSTVTVFVDAMDYAGNQIQKQLTLQVQ